MSSGPALAPRGFALGESKQRAHTVGLYVVVLFAAGTLAAVIDQMRPVMKACGETKPQIARAAVFKYAFEAYPSWRLAHPDEECPADLVALNEWTNRKDVRDPWGRDFRWECPYRSGGVSLLVESAGPDRRFGTTDDIRSTP